MIRSRRGWRWVAAGAGIALAIAWSDSRSFAISRTKPAASAASSAVDEFERDTLGPSWAVALGSVGICNRSDLGLTSSSPIGIVSWVGSNLGPDQHSDATIAADRPSNMLLQVYARRRQSDGARYGLHYDDDLGDGSPGASAWQIKFDGVPNAQTRILASRAAPGPSAGDVIRLEVRGSGPVELKGFRNGTLILTATDSSASAITNGSPGMAFRLRVGTSTRYPAPVVERWSGGVLAPEPGPTSTQVPSPSVPDTSVPATSGPTSPGPVGSGPANSGSVASRPRASGPGGGDTTSTLAVDGRSPSTDPATGGGPTGDPGEEASRRGAEEAQAAGSSRPPDGNGPLLGVALTLGAVAAGTAFAVARRRRVRSRL